MAMASSDSSSGGNGDRDVFGSLPNTRPQRRSARRDRAGAKAKPTASAGDGEGRSPPLGKADGAGEARRAAAAKPTPLLRPSPPLARSPPASSPPGEARRSGEARGRGSSGRAAPTRRSKIPPAGYATPRDDDDGVPHGAELVTTAVQAAGELAQIGLAAGGRALKSALGRLPRP